MLGKHAHGITVLAAGAAGDFSGKEPGIAFVLAVVTHGYRARAWDLAEGIDAAVKELHFHIVG